MHLSYMKQIYHDGQQTRNDVLRNFERMNSTIYSPFGTLGSNLLEAATNNPRNHDMKC